MMNLEEVLINKCIEHYKSLNGEKKFFSDSEKYGKLPSRLIIVYCDAIRRTEHHYKTIPQRCWLYENSVLKEQNINLEDDEANQQNGIFYSTASARFYWDLDKGKAFLGIMFGPRFGRGFSYSIKQNGRDFILDDEDIEWVS